MKKTIKVSNAQVVTIVEGFNRMNKHDVNLPALLTYTLVKNIRVLEPTYNTITETKNLLIKKHQKSDGGIKQGTKEFNSFLDEFAPVLREANEFELDMVPASVFEKIEISLADMLALEFMIED